MIFIIKYYELVMKKNRIRLTESQLHKVIKESIQTILNETSYDTSKRAFKKAGEKLLSLPYNDKNAFKKAQKQYNSLHGYFKDKSRENFNPKMPVIICTTNGCFNMLAGDLEKKFNIVGYVEPSENHIYADSKIIGYPKIKGLLGPMWDGDRVRYEDQSTYDALSI